MWIDKLECGVLRVLTPLGPRYIQLSFLQRIYLLWMFRHFDTLPQLVLSPRQQQMIDALCSEHRFVSWPNGSGLEDMFVIGTVERRASKTVERFTPQETSTSPEARRVSPLVVNLRQRT